VTTQAIPAHRGSTSCDVLGNCEKHSQSAPENVCSIPNCAPNASQIGPVTTPPRHEIWSSTALPAGDYGSIGSVALEPIVNQRLYQQVADSIRKQIQSGSMAPGSRLPSEKLLAQQLGVSRPTVREAMIALEIAGLVEIRTGSGSYVRHRDSIAAPSVDTGPGPIELLNARMLIEGEIAAEAAQRATAEDLVEIAQTLTEMESIIARGEHSRSADQDFHVRIARASGNDVLASIVGELWAGMFSPLFHQFSERTRLVRRQDAALHEHRAIYAALRTHDAIGARAAMRHHLMQVQAVLANAELSKD
jgi:DNA-binding FadR family transcriptional regulator